MSKISIIPNANIISNINSPTSRPIPSVTIPNMSDFALISPTITLPNNNIYKLDAILSDTNQYTYTYYDYLQDLINIPPIPPTLDLRNNLFPIRNQGPYGSGTGYAACVIIEWQKANIGDYSKYLSPAYIYINRPNGTLNQGMYLSDACDILSNLGTCTDETFGYSIIDIKTIYRLTPNDIPENAKIEANKYRTSNAVLIKTIDQLKIALYIHGPCIFGVNVYGWKHAMWVPLDFSNLAYGLKGAHCMTFVGYNDKGFLVRNSWGVDWNKEYWIEQNIKNSGGYDLLPYDDFKYVNEIWTTTDISSTIPLTIQSESTSTSISTTIICVIFIIVVIYSIFISKRGY
jgi:hypothetical protein